MALAAWMVYALGVSVLLTAAAWLLDRGLARIGLATRWVWMAALALSVIVPAARWTAGPAQGSPPAPPPAGAAAGDSRAALDTGGAGGGGAAAGAAAAAGVAGPSSLLTRRLSAMKRTDVRRGIPVALGAAVAAAGILVVACETPAPAGPGEEGAAAEVGAGGAEVQEVPALPIRLRGIGVEGVGGPAEEAGLEDVPPSLLAIRAEDIRLFLGDGDDPRPLVIVDGVIVGTAIPERAAAAGIVSIEINRGEAASRLYGSRASAGVISITTRPAAAGGGS